MMDALTQLRYQGAWQARQWREISLLRQDIRQGRRHDILAIAGMGGGFIVALLTTGASATIGAVIALLALSWRMLR
jgi:tRNA A22 N-methylase